MRRKLWISLVCLALWLGAGAIGHAAVLHCDGGLLADDQAATGASANVFNPGRALGVAFQYVRSAGTAIIQIESCCTNTSESCTPWFVVANSSLTVDGTTSTKGVGIDHPACLYRANVTTCTSCTVDVTVDCGASGNW